MNEQRAKLVAFADEAVRDAFEKLKEGKYEEKELANRIQGAIDKLKDDPFAGVAVPRSIWPDEYVQKYEINNLRKYNLPDGWRLVYTLHGSEIEIVSIILEWMNHKEYEKRFGYKTQ